MKIVHSELDGKEGGSCTVVMEESDDLWVLYNLVDPDDEVKCSTLRKITKNDRSGAKVASEKRRVTLTCRAISAEYDGIADARFAARLSRSLLLVRETWRGTWIESSTGVPPSP